MGVLWDQMRPLIPRANYFCQMCVCVCFLRVLYPFLGWLKLPFRRAGVGTKPDSGRSFLCCMGVPTKKMD